MSKTKIHFGWEMALIPDYIKTACGLLYAPEKLRFSRDWRDITCKSCLKTKIKKFWQEVNPL